MMFVRKKLPQHKKKRKKNNETKEERPPPYAPSCGQAVNQMPIVQGKIDLKGPIEFEGYLHDENTEVEKEQSCTREVRGTVGKKYTLTQPLGRGWSN